MEKIINDRYNNFTTYCKKNMSWLVTKKIPQIQMLNRKEAILIEFRVLPHIEFIILNTIRVLGPLWSHTIVCGNLNYKFICDFVKKLNRKVRIIKMEKDNLNRLDYSLMLLTSDFYKQFYGENLLIYQEDSIIFKDIPEYYFKYDFVGAPLPNMRTKFNGGFSLRNKKEMINICEKIYDKFAENLIESKKYLESKNDILLKKDINYKKDIRFLFLYKIEESLLEDICICNFIQKKPTFQEAVEFSVEKYFFKNPIGGHQFWYSINNIELWLDTNLKKIIY